MFDSLNHDGVKRPGTREMTLMLAGLMALNAFAIDAMVPALPDIGRSFHVVRENDRQLVVIAYFVGFRVQEAADGTIALDRQKGVVNVISLKGVSEKPDGPIKVKMTGSGKVICEDIAKSCIPEVFYDNQ